MPVCGSVGAGRSAGRRPAAGAGLRCRAAAAAGSVPSGRTRRGVLGGGACWARRSGASTMIMLRPSSLGAASTLATSPTCSATWSRIFLPELGMAHLPAPEHDRDLDLVAFGEEPGDLAGLGVEVAGPDLGPVLHLLDAGAGGLAPRLLGPLRLVELELAVVHDPADRRVGLGRHLDEVEIQLPGDGERLGQRLDPELLAVGIDEADLPGADPIVDPVLVVVGCSGYAASLLVIGPLTRKRQASGSNARPLAVDRPGAPHWWPGGGRGPASRFRLCIVG